MQLSTLHTVIWPPALRSMQVKRQRTVHLYQRRIARAPPRARKMPRQISHARQNSFSTSLLLAYSTAKDVVLAASAAAASTERAPYRIESSGGFMRERSLPDICKRTSGKTRRRLARLSGTAVRWW
jgi:hypothetical protein